jgi:PD-(D/E)XK endonuclease
VNTREQGDIGEMSAAAWLAQRGAPVYIPFGHSPDVDLVTWWDGRFVGVQVKTSMHRTPKDFFSVAVCTRGGNQSWNKIVKRFDATRCDYLFALVGDGRRWFIPSQAVEATTSITLGGPKYAEYEVERGRPILASVA